MIVYIATITVLAAAAASFTYWRKRSRRAAAQPGGRPVDALERAADRLPPQPDAAASASVRMARKPGEPRHVLVVDDMPAIRMLLAEVLRTAGFIVHEADNGKKAVELAGSMPIDAVLLDLKMPDMDGVEVLEAIRRIDANVHAVMISAYGDGDKIEAAKRLGVKKFFTKPFDIDQLRDYVLEALS